MKIVIDTELDAIIVPDTFYKQIDDKNKVLVEAGAGDKKIEYVDFVKKAYESAINNPFLRSSDAKKK